MGGMNMNTNEYVKFLTQQFVQYYDQPKEQRKKHRLERKENRTDFISEWFGVIPFAIMMLFIKK